MTTCYLSILPEVIYPIIRNFLCTECYVDETGDGQGDRRRISQNLRSWRNFLNCSKALFQPPHSTIKSNNIFYNLDTLYSRAYLSFERGGNIDVVEAVIRKIRHIIQDPMRQLSLTLEGRFFLIEPLKSNLYVYCNQLICNGFFGKTLSFVQGNTNVLSLSNVNHIDDIAPLQDLQHLQLNRISILKDVSCLNRLYSLHLCNCPRVIDVSMLGCLHQLKLENCPKITDISNLGSVHTLILIGCNITTFLPSENNVKVLSCSFQFFTEVLLFHNKHEKKLILSQIRQNIDVNLLNEFKELGFWNVLLKGSRLIPLDESSEAPLMEAYVEVHQPQPIQRVTLYGRSSVAKTEFNKLVYLTLHGSRFMMEIDFDVFVNLKQCWLLYSDIKTIHVRGPIEILTITSHFSEEVDVHIHPTATALRLLHIEYCKMIGRIRLMNGSPSLVVKRVNSDKFEVM